METFNSYCNVCSTWCTVNINLKVDYELALIMETENTRFFKSVFWWAGFITMILCGLALYLISNNHIGWAMFVTFFAVIGSVVAVIADTTYTHFKW